MALPMGSLPWNATLLLFFLAALLGLRNQPPMAQPRAGWPRALRIILALAVGVTFGWFSRWSDPLAIAVVVFSLLCVLAYVLVPWVYLPVRVRSAVWFSAHTDYVPFNPESPETPREVSASVRGMVSPLAAEGFIQRGHFWAERHQSVMEYVSLFENPEIQDVALLATLFADNPGRSTPVTNLAFVTEFADGSEVVTDNDGEPPTLPAFEGLSRAAFPDVGDPRRLHAIHRKLVSRLGPTNEKRSTVGKDPVAYLRSAASEEMDRYVDAGYCYLDETTDRHRLTWQGALLMCWKSRWPVISLRRFFHRRASARLLRMIEG